MREKNIHDDIFGRTPKGNQGIDGNKKGKKAERVVCNLLSKWTGQELVRTPASGGMRWRTSSNVCGDVVCTNLTFNFPFIIEGKHYEYFELKSPLRANSKLFGFYRQARRDADRAGKAPLLFARRNGMNVNEQVVFGELEGMNAAAKLLALPVSFYGDHPDGYAIGGLEFEHLKILGYEKFLELLPLLQ